MKYIEQNTKIPVPHVIGYGDACDNPIGLGPFIIMTWVEGKKMSDIPRRDGAPGKEDIFDPGIEEKTLRILYGHMADILLEL